MNRDDVLKVDALKEQLTDAFRQFERSLRGVFGELVYSVDTVVERYNALEAKHDTLQGQVDQLAARLLALERLRGEH